MKKIKVLSLASLPLAMALLAGCNDDPEPEPDPDPEPQTSNVVSKEEWAAAFGSDKVYGFADNYKLLESFAFSEGQTSTEYIIDGLKMKVTSTYGELSQEMYHTSEDGKFYQIHKSGDKWLKESEKSNPSYDYRTYLEPFGPNYESFAYSVTSDSYKCETFEYKGTAIKNLELKFNNKQIVFAKLEADMDGGSMAFIANISYGGQSVTLPETEPAHEHAYTVQNHDEFTHWMECECGVKDFSTREPHIDEIEDGFCDVCGAEMGSSPLPGEPVYGYKLNDGSFVLMSGPDKANQYTAIDVAMSEGDTITFANIVNPMDPLYMPGIKIGGETQGFTVDKGVFTAGHDGSYNFYFQPEFENDIVYIAENSSPTPEADCRLMGMDDDWEGGIIMVPVSKGSSQYVARNLDIDSGDKVKVKFGDDWISDYKTGGYGNALDDHLAEIDGEGNVQFNFGGVYTVYFESDVEGSFGVFVSRESVDCPYVGSADMTTPSGEIHQDATFFFHKVDLANNFIEYYLNNCPAYDGMSYTIKNGDNPVTFTFEDTAGEGPNFDQSGSTITYHGSADALNFYLKEDLTSHELSVYVEIHGDPAMYNTLYLNPGDWANDGATFYAYFFDSTGTNTAIWVALTSEDGLYKVDKVEGYDKIIFVRCDPTKDPLVDDWGAKWNQTDDLDVPADANIKCTITGWGEPGANSTVSWGTK